MYDRQHDTGRLPFDGLGFDLAGVTIRAALVTLRVSRPAEARVRPAVETGGRRTFGYELLLMLNREIRGT